MTGLEAVAAAAAATAATYLLTVVDGLALMLALTPGRGALRAVAPFLAAQAAVFAAAWIGAAFGAAMVPADRLWLLGLAPLTMGLWEVLFGGGETAAPRAGFWAAAAAFAALSTDGLALLTAALADGAAGRDAAVWSGAALAVAAATTLVLIAGGVRARGATHVAERIAPWAMIAAGLWIIADTPGDLS